MGVDPSLLAPFRLAEDEGQDKVNGFQEAIQKYIQFCMSIHIVKDAVVSRRPLDPHCFFTRD